MKEFIEFLQSSFWHVAPVLLCGMFAIGIVVERWQALFVRYPIKDQLQWMSQIQTLLLAGKVKEAISICEKTPEKPAAQVVKQALGRAHLPEEMIQDGLELTVRSVSQNLHKRTAFLATVANVATLLGLFGTIAGLIHSFEAVGHADAQQKSALLAAGISQAMNATMLGLGVAIPCMVAFSFLINRTGQLQHEIDHAALSVMDLLKQRYIASEIDTDEADRFVEKALGKSGALANGKVAA